MSGAPALVSVIIPARDAAPTLARAVESALAQSWRPIEILVVDDGSTDATVAIAAEYRLRGVRLLRTREPAEGAAAARNRAVAEARGQYLAFLDADDEWSPEKTARQVGALEACPAAVLSGCGGRFLDAEGRPCGDMFSSTPAVTGADAWKTLLAYSFLATPAVVVRAAAFAAAGGFDQSLAAGEDQDLWIRLALMGPLVIVPEELVTVHVRPGSLGNRDRVATARCLQRVVERHLTAQRHRLTRAERRRVRAYRNGEIGRALWGAGQGGVRLEGAGLLLDAFVAGAPARDTLWPLLTESPPARWIGHRRTPRI